MIGTQAQTVQQVDVRSKPAADAWIRRFLRGLGWKAFFIGVPAVLFFVPLVAAIQLNADWAFDFKQFWQGARDIVDGVSPYPSRDLLQSADDSLGPVGIQEVFRFPYPAPCAWLLVPFGVLPFNVAATIYTVLAAAAIPAGLRLVGVKDVRILTLTFGFATVGGAIRLGTLTPMLFLACALLWRYRDRRWIAASATSVAVVMKMFLWPLAIWLLATRRVAAGLTAIGLVAGATIAGWAAIGFTGMASYPELLDKLTGVVADRGYSMVALGTQLGLDEGSAGVLPYVIGAPILVWAVIVGRRGRERESFALALAASIVLTPIVWQHYFTLLLLPLAIARPRFSWAWLLPLAYWAAPTQETFGDLWRTAIGLGLSVAVVVLAVRSPAEEQASVPSSVGSPTPVSVS